MARGTYFGRLERVVRGEVDVQKVDASRVRRVGLYTRNRARGVAKTTTTSGRPNTIKTDDFSVSSQQSTQKTQNRHTEAPAHRKRVVDKAQPTHTVALKCRRLRRQHCRHRQREGSHTARIGPSPITEAWGATQSKDTRNKRGRLPRETYRAHDSRLPVEEVISRWAGRAIRRRVAAEVLQLFYSHSIPQRQRQSSSIITEQQGGTAARTHEPPDSEWPNRSVSFSKEATRGRIHSLRGTSMASLRRPPQT